MITHVIFDLDGVLVEAKRWHYLALNDALEFFDPKYKISLLDHNTRFNGLLTKKKLEILSIERNLPTDLHDSINKLKQEYTIQYILKFCKPRKNITTVLKVLKSKNIKMAVCSNSVKQTLTLMLEKSEILNYFEFFLSNEDVKSPKPDPEMYNTAINRFGIGPQNCLIVEDNEKGVRAATGSGANVLKVKNTADVKIRKILKEIKKCSTLHTEAT